jgi:integrase
VLREQQARCEERVAAIEVEMDGEARVFSYEPDGSTCWLPDTVTQRCGRMVAKLGIETHLHALRHYTATELITAGVDARTVAGRLGHAGGGATTLRVYAAWVSEADQRAAASLAARMPKRPTS